MAYLSRTCLVPVSYIPCGSRSTWDVRDRYEIGTREQHGRHTVAIPSHGYTIEPHRHLAGGSLPGWSCGEPDKKGISMDLLPACSNDRNVVFLRNYGFCRREREVELVLGCTDNRYMGHRVRARGLQEVVGRVPSRGDIANFCNQALACTTVEVTQDDRLYRRVVSPSIMGRCPDSGVSSCPAWTCGQKAPAGAGAGSKRSLMQMFPGRRPFSGSPG